jgi:hypothetical protein
MKETIDNLIAERSLPVMIMSISTVQTIGGEQKVVAFCTESGDLLGGVQGDEKDLPALSGKFLDDLEEKLNTNPK